MIVTLQTQRVQTLEQVRRVAEGTEPVDFAPADRASAYDFIRRTLVQFEYWALRNLSTTLRQRRLGFTEQAVAS